MNIATPRATNVALMPTVRQSMHRAVAIGVAVGMATRRTIRALARPVKQHERNYSGEHLWPLEPIKAASVLASCSSQKLLHPHTNPTIANEQFNT